MTNTPLPFHAPRPCTCNDCRCAVTVTSLHSQCRACRNGGHELRSWKQIRLERQRARDGSRAA
jgi:hypothetical protein